MSLRKYVLFVLLGISSSAFAVKPPLTVQSAGSPEGKRLTELASQCAEEHSDLSGEISTRLTRFRSNQASLSSQGRQAVMALAGKRNLSKEDCIDISSMMSNR